jgi:hypothetical protein
MFGQHNPSPQESKAHSEESSLKYDRLSTIYLALTGVHADLSRRVPNNVVSVARQSNYNYLPSQAIQLAPDTHNFAIPAAAVNIEAPKLTAAYQPVEPKTSVKQFATPIENRHLDESQIRADLEEIYGSSNQTDAA